MDITLRDAFDEDRKSDPFGVIIFIVLNVPLIFNLYATCELNWTTCNATVDMPGNVKSPTLASLHSST